MTMQEPDLTDEYLDFGSVLFPLGRAFVAEQTPAQPGEPARIGRVIPGSGDVLVGKHWLVAGNINVLVESVDWSDLEPLLKNLEQAALGTPARRFGVTSVSFPGSGTAPVFTSKDDDLFGQIISGTTSSPTYMANPALALYHPASNTTVQNALFRWCKTAIAYSAVGSHYLSSSSVQHAQTGIYAYLPSASLTLDNVKQCDVTTAVVLTRTRDLGSNWTDIMTFPSAYADRPVLATGSGGTNAYASVWLMSIDGSRLTVRGAGIASNGVVRTNDRAYLAYTDAASTNLNETNTDIWVRYSTDTGANWSEPVKVNTDSPNSQFFAGLAVDPWSGWVAVSWYDCRNDANNESTQIFAAVSKDGFSTRPSSNVQINPVASYASQDDCYETYINYGDYIGLVFHGKILLPVWSSYPAGACADIHACRLPW